MKTRLPPSFLWLTFFRLLKMTILRVVLLLLLFKLLTNRHFIITTVACQEDHTSFNKHDLIDNYLHGRFHLLVSM